MSYDKFMVESIQEREKVFPQEVLPVVWDQIDAWMRPKIIEATPPHIKEWVDQRAQQGQVDPSHVVLFYLMKTFAPGGAEEKNQLHSKILNPNPCSNPRAAQVEYLRWKDNLKRYRELKCSPPDLTMAYSAMESIFSAVFDKAEAQLNHRWVELRNRLGLPYRITIDSMEKVGEFAEYELSAMVLHGGTGLNTGLPLTGNQKFQLQQQRDNDKKRAAAAKIVAAPVEGPSRSKTEPDVAAAVRVSATTAMWAGACHNWSKGSCSKGISCHFAHSGFPITENRCVICGETNHTSRECKAPGGGADPKRDESWAEYRTRRDVAVAAGKMPPPKGKGKSGGKQSRKGKGKGKGKRKGKDEQEKAHAKAVIDPMVGVECPESHLGGTFRASAVLIASVFPRNAIGLDSWANVHVIHQKGRRASDYDQSLVLAHGTCMCHRETGRKGVPRVLVPWSKEGDNIDLFPEGFLWGRGCSITRAAEHQLQTPKGRIIKLQMWGSLP